MMDTTVLLVKEANRRSSSMSPVATATAGRPVSAAHNHEAPAEQRLYRVCRVAGVACMNVYASTRDWPDANSGREAVAPNVAGSAQNIPSSVSARLETIVGSSSWTRGPDDYPLRHRNGGCCGSLAEEAQPKGVLQASQQPIVVSRGAERGSVRHAGAGHDGEQC